jgi:hypothetical protein
VTDNVIATAAVGFGSGPVTVRDRTPVRVAIELAGAGHHPGVDGPTAAPAGWWDLSAATGPAGSASIVRIRATDLIMAAQQTARIKAGAGREGRDPADVTVLVDLEVMIADDAGIARGILAGLDSRVAGPPASVRYVGTPAGLAGLIADIHTVHVADGVTLLPLVTSQVLAHIMFGTVPELEAAGVPLAAEPVATLRRWSAV